MVAGRAGHRAGMTTRPRLAAAVRGSVSGLLAGACGTTALNAATYLDMALRGRPSSSTPVQTVERAADALHVAVPGEDDARQNRISGLGALSGIGAGAVTGALVGLARGLGWRASAPVTGAVTFAVASMAGNVPVAAAGISDPRRWTRREWIADLLPHLAYA